MHSIEHAAAFKKDFKLVKATPKHAKYIDGFLVNVLKLLITNQSLPDNYKDKFLETAVKGNAQFIISGDQDLLTMHRFEGNDIVTVQEFAVYTV